MGIPLVKVGGVEPRDKNTGCDLNLTIACLGFIGLLHLFITPHLQAQPIPSYFEHYTVEQGLSQNSVYAMLQDQKGFLWLGTEDGLNRYDGHEMKVYRTSSQEASISDNHIITLYEDHAGLLWVGTEGGGLNKFDPATELFTRYRHDPQNAQSLGHVQVTALYEDRSRTFWVGTWGGGLSQFDRIHETFVHYRHDPAVETSLGDDRVQVIFQDRAGTLWIGTAGGGLNMFVPDEGTFIRYNFDLFGGGPASNSIGAIFEDLNGFLWLGTDGGGLIRFDPSSGIHTQYENDPENPQSLGDNRVTALLEDQTGLIWLGTMGGLSVLDRTRKTFQTFQYDSADSRTLSDNTVLSLLEDRSGVLWVGTWSGGLNKLNPASRVFERYEYSTHKPNSLSDREVWDIHEDQSGTVWVGTQAGGLNRIDRGGNRIASYQHDPFELGSLPDAPIRAIAEDRAGTFWLGTNGSGIGQFDRNSGVFLPYKSSSGNGDMGAERVFVLLPDQAGNLWLGTWGNGLKRLETDRMEVVSYPWGREDASGLRGSRIRAMHQSEQGLLWIGTSDAGLSVLDVATDQFRHYGHKPEDPSSLISDDIFSLYEGPSGMIWVGTDLGFNRLDPTQQTITRYTEEHGLPNNVVYGILPDGQGYLWLSTNNGLSRFDPQQEVFVNFDYQDGLQSNEFNGTAHHRGRSGTLYFGGIAGVNAFRPEQIRTNNHQPPVVLTSFKKLNNEVVLDRALADIDFITLSYEDEVISFSFAALDYWSPEKNSYAYFLEGFNEDWIDWGTQRSVTFTNLDWRDYTLRIRGRNNHGVWSDEGLSVRLRITPPFWGTWWFRGGMLVVFGLFLYGVYQVRTQGIRSRNKALEEEITAREKAEAEREAFIHELEAKNAELERFTYTVSHDLKSPLITIRGFLGFVAEDARQGDLDKLGEDISVIEGATDTMYRLLGELLELSRIGRIVNPPEMVLVSDLVQAALDAIQGRLAHSGIELIVHPTLDSLKVNVDRVRLIEVFQNLIENAVKFMGGHQEPRIEIGASAANGMVKCYVRDNGKGIEDRYHEKVFGLFEKLNAEEEGTGIGLALVKRIVEVHGGEVGVISEGEGKGATIWFTLPTASSVH